MKVVRWLINMIMMAMMLQDDHDDHADHDGMMLQVSEKYKTYYHIIKKIKLGVGAGEYSRKKSWNRPFL